jgi:hypothetical protein
MMPPKQPKITQKLIVRTAISLFVLAGLVLAFNWYKSNENDIRGGTTRETIGWIAAIESVGAGKHAVFIKPDGTVVRQSNVSADSEDRDVVWRPDGNFAFFPSNREKGKFTMFRWSPDSPTAEMRSMQGLTQAAPYFSSADADLHQTAEALICASGFVMQYDPNKQTTHQVLPPPDPKARAQQDSEGGGQVSPFEGLYERFGSSFRVAKWSPDKKAIIAVMRRETGEVLIYQKLDFTTELEGRPRAIVAGDKIDFDIDQTSGLVYFSVENFQWPFPEAAPPEFKKGGKVTTPYRHGVGVLDPAHPGPVKMLATSKDDTIAFGELALAPTGDKIAVVGGSYEGSGNITRKGLLQMVLGAAAPTTTVVAPGNTFEPTWSPDGKKLAFALRESTTSRPIYVLDDGSATPHRLTTGEGVFAFPRFSPQK